MAERPTLDEVWDALEEDDPSRWRDGADEAALARAAAALGRPLPADLADALRRHDGAVPHRSPGSFELLSVDDAIRVFRELELDPEARAVRALVGPGIRWWPLQRSVTTGAVVCLELGGDREPVVLHGWQGRREEQADDFLEWFARELGGFEPPAPPTASLAEAVARVLGGNPHDIEVELAARIRDASEAAEATPDVGVDVLGLWTVTVRPSVIRGHRIVTRSVVATRALQAPVQARTAAAGPSSLADGVVAAVVAHGLGTLVLPGVLEVTVERVRANVTREGFRPELRRVVTRLVRER